MADEPDFVPIAKDTFTGQRLGRYELICKLGQGGMAQVFLAWQHGVGGYRRLVVVKSLMNAMRHHREFLQMFVSEAKILSGLSHGNIAQLYDLGFEQSQLFIVMEYVAGATMVELAKTCRARNLEPPLGLILPALHEVAQALHASHTFVDPMGAPRTIIHRDVSEKNIMVGFDGSAKLLDFGIAHQEGKPHLTAVGMVKGTAGYLSPEQARGEELDPRTDVFSLGIVLFEMLTSTRLFRETRRPDDRFNLFVGPLPSPSERNPKVGPRLDAVVMRALERDRDRRYRTCKDLGDALADAAAELFWDADRRRGFMERTFGDRRQQLLALVGNPAVTNVDELLTPSDETLRQTRVDRAPNPFVPEKTVRIDEPPRQTVELPGKGSPTPMPLSHVDPSNWTIISEPHKANAAATHQDTHSFEPQFEPVAAPPSGASPSELHDKEQFERVRWLLVGGAGLILLIAALVLALRP